MTQANASAEIQVRSDTFASNSAAFAALALLIYDTLLTLPSEIRHIWCKTVKIGSIFYILARYMPLGLLLVAMYNNLFNISLEKCNALSHLTGVCQPPSLIGVQSLLLARTYAISVHNRRVLGGLGMIMLVAFIVEMGHSVLSSCKPTISQRNTLDLLATVNNVTLILFDTMVVIITILSSIGTLRFWKKGEVWDKKSLISLLIYQGIIRYGFVLTIGLANTIATEVLRPSLSGIFGRPQNSLSVIIVCRFHLTLKERLSQHGNLSLPTLSFISFQAARQSVHTAIVAEFGNPCLDQDCSTETLEDSRESSDEAGSAR